MHFWAYSHLFFLSYHIRMVEVSFAVIYDAHGSITLYFCHIFCPNGKKRQLIWRIRSVYMCFFSLQFIVSRNFRAIGYRQQWRNKDILNVFFPTSFHLLPFNREKNAFKILLFSFWRLLSDIWLSEQFKCRSIPFTSAAVFNAPKPNRSNYNLLKCYIESSSKYMNSVNSEINHSAFHSQFRKNHRRKIIGSFLVNL